MLPIDILMDIDQALVENHIKKTPSNMPDFIKKIKADRTEDV